MGAGDSFSWYADASVHYGGFLICGSTSPVAVPPMTPPPSPSPPPPTIEPPSPPASPYVAMWEIVSGAQFCHVTNLGTCVTDGVGDHANDEACVIRTTRPLYATYTYFQTETGFDFVTITAPPANSPTSPAVSTQYSGGGGPINVLMMPGNTLQWQSDGSVTYGGWVICGSATPTVMSPPQPSPPPPTMSPAPPAIAGAMWIVISGGQFCEVSSNGQCVSDGQAPHGNNENCVVQATQALYAHATSFLTETYFDYITINNTRYSGSTGPVNVRMNAGQTMSWYSDYSVTADGFNICGYYTPTTLPPRPPPPPPPSPSPPPPAYSPAPPHPTNHLWAIVDGTEFCHVINNGMCVTDGEGDHSHNEHCVMVPTQPIYATATYFATETFCACTRHPEPEARSVAILSTRLL